MRPGVFETRASFLRPAIALSSDDLPTFDRPTNAISARVGGQLAEIRGRKDELELQRSTHDRVILVQTGVVSGAHTGSAMGDDGR